MASPNDMRGAPPHHVHIEKKKINWLAWLLLALGVLALLFALGRRGHSEAVVPAAVPVAAQAPSTPAVGVQRVTLPGGKTVDLQPATLDYDLQQYLASGAAVPRTFTFDKLNFDTASSQIRADDQPTLNALSQILAAYPNAKVRLVGYADARGSGPANDKLGSDRAQAVARALTDSGISTSRVTTASGGDSNPVGSNATAGGQFENRRTDLVVTGK